MSLALRNAAAAAILVTREHWSCRACRQPTLPVDSNNEFIRERCIACGQEHHVFKEGECSPDTSAQTAPIGTRWQGSPPKSCSS